MIVALPKESRFVCFNCHQPRHCAEIQCLLEVRSVWMCEACLRAALETGFPKPDGGLKILVAKAMPDSWQSRDTPENAIKLCNAFLALNSVEPPRYEFKTGERGGPALGHYNRYTKVVTVFPNLCHGGGRARSFPGFWEDASVLGVTAHEVGHHVENERGWRSASNGMYDAYMKERPMVLNSKLSRTEDFADCMQFLMTNPSMLEECCPLRFKYVTGRLKLKPTETRHWREVLAESPEHVKYLEERTTT